MDQSRINARLAELRAQYPRMFSHPDAKPGEICLGPTVSSFGAFNLAVKGVKSARMESSDATMEVRIASGSGPMRWERIGAWMMFANEREFAEYLIKHS